MGNKILKKILLMLLPISMVICSCSGANQKSDSEDKAKEALPEITVKQL